MAKAMKFGSGKAKRYNEGGDLEVPEAGTGLKKETRGEAFARARRTGQKTFEFGGKKYTTETKEEEAARKAAALAKRPDESAAETSRNIRAAADAQRRKVEASDKPLESVNPEDYIGVGAALKAIPKLAARVAAKFATKASPKAFVKREPTYEAPAEAARRPRDIDEARFADEGNPNFRRGGKVKKMASGGSTSSASRRADGIATKGKTRGRIY